MKKNFLRNVNLKLDSEKLLAGIFMLVLNIGSKYITIEFSETQKQLFNYSIFRQLLIFSICWVGTRDIYHSIVLTAAFVILSDYLLNENSNLCILPENLKVVIDTNNDGKLSKDEIEKAINTLKRGNK